mgnify:CR=1 FL=1|tara:strand:+ start:363 stop:602 length:240 start_codon:yes stop_codon:yes gene_type:complete
MIRIPRISEELEDLMMYLIGYSTQSEGVIHSNLLFAGVYQEGVEMGTDGEPRWSAYTVNTLIRMCNDKWGMNIKEVKEE